MPYPTLGPDKFHKERIIENEFAQDKILKFFHESFKNLEIYFQNERGVSAESFSWVFSVLRRSIREMTYQGIKIRSVFRDLSRRKPARRPHETTSRLPRVVTPPGTRLLAVVDFLYSPKTVELTFKAIVADWQSEYFEALKQGRPVKAKWISVRYTVKFVTAMGLSKVLSVIRSVLTAGR